MRRPPFPRRTRFLPPLLAACALLAAGCRQGADEARGATAPDAAAERPVRGGTAVLGVSSDIAGVNELIFPSNSPTNDALQVLFLHLVEEQGDYAEHPPTFAPELAERYEFSPDHKVLTFHLRPDAVWSDGVPISAEDVRWTWQAQRHPDVGWGEAPAKERITDVEAVDPHTVRFHFREVSSKQLMEANEGVILPKHAWSKLPFSEWRRSGDWFREHMVTSGPFRLAAWTPQQELVLERNPRYFAAGLPYLDRVVLRVVPEQSSMLTGLLNGELHFASGLAPGDAPAVRADPDLKLVAYWHRLFVMVAWNTEDPRFADPEVRRALAMAIDRQALVDALWGEFARVGSSALVRDVWAHHPRLPELRYDPQGARRILARHGWRDSDGDGVLDKDGQPFAFELTTNATNKQRVDATVMIQEQLRRIGVKAEARALEFHTLNEQVSDGTFDATIAGLGMDTSLDLTSVFHSGAIENANNISRYRNPEVDRLIERVLRYPEIGQARDDLYRLQEILDRDQPFTYLWESQRINGASRRLRDIRSNTIFALFDLEEWWLRPAT